VGDIQTWQYIQPIDVAAVSAEFRATMGIRHFFIDDFLRPEFAHAVADAYPSFEQAELAGRRYSDLHETGKVQVTDPSAFSEPVARLNEALASDEFLQTLVEITGIEELLADPTLQGGGIHLMNSGSRLDVHVDFNVTASRKLFRRLNLLVFLTPDWQPEWGGRFELWDPTVRNKQRAFEPRFNRALCFATSETSFHGVEPVSCPAPQLRRSFATYYYTASPHPDWSGSHHTTIFRNRPGERVRALWAFPRRATRQLVNTVRRWKARLQQRS